MTHDPYAEMQEAVDIVNGSRHPTNKIAATLAGSEAGGAPFNISMTNYWPDRIHQRFGAEARFGDASGTIHAETACLLTAPCTNGGTIYVTDPFCPNCAKNMAEAGIVAVYVDHKGFEKDFAARRASEFQDMSLRICEKAGIGVYRIDRKERRIDPLLVPAPRDRVEERPVTVVPINVPDRDTLDAIVRQQVEIAAQRKFAVALARNDAGDAFALAAFGHVAVGYSWEADQDEIIIGADKYTFMLEPVNRLLMNAGRHGIGLIDGLIYCTRVPTAREQVNMIGADLTAMTVGDRARARDQYALDAMAIFEAAGILSFTQA